MARPGVPRRVGRIVVRVDVARTIVTTVIHVSTTANRAHHVGINEVGVREETSTKVHCNPKFAEIITAYSIIFLLLLENNGMRYKKGSVICLLGACGPLCRLRGIHPYWVKKRPDPEYQDA